MKYSNLLICIGLLFGIQIWSQNSFEWQLPALPSQSGDTYNRTLGGATGALGRGTSFYENPAILAQQKYSFSSGISTQLLNNSNSLSSDNMTKFNILDPYLEFHINTDYLESALTSVGVGIGMHVKNRWNIALNPTGFGKSISSFYLQQAQFHVANVTTEEQKAPNFLFDPQGNPLDAGYGYQTEIINYNEKTKTYALAHDYSSPTSQSLTYNISARQIEYPFAIALELYNSLRIGLGITLVEQEFSNSFSYREAHDNKARNRIDFERDFAKIRTDNERGLNYYTFGIQHSFNQTWHIGLSYLSERTQYLTETFDLPFLSQTVGNTGYVIDPRQSSNYSGPYFFPDFLKVTTPSQTHLSVAYLWENTSYRAQVVIPNIWDKDYRTDHQHKVVPLDVELRAGIETLFLDNEISWRVGTQIHNPSDINYFSVATGLSFWLNPISIDLGVQYEERRNLDFTFLTKDILNANFSIQQFQTLLSLTYFY